MVFLSSRRVEALHVDLEKSSPKFDLNSRSHEVTWLPSRSCCISVDAPWREEHIVITATALCLFYQMLEAEKTRLTSYDLE